MLSPLSSGTFSARGSVSVSVSVWHTFSVFLRQLSVHSAVVSVALVQLQLHLQQLIVFVVALPSLSVAIAIPVVVLS